MSFLQKIIRNKYYFIPLLILIVVVIFTYVKTTQIGCNDCNVILISIDALRPDHMGTYGYKKNTTPNIDKWAKDATVFNNAYTIFPLTPQSFFTLFTGIDRVLSNNLLSVAYATNINYYQDKQSLPLILTQNSYTTAGFVTNQLLGAVYGYFGSQFNYLKFNNSSGLGDFDPLLADFAYNDQKLLTSRALEWLGKNRNNKFFLWLHYLNPHHPYNAPDSYLCKIDPNCKLDTYKDKLDTDKPEQCSQVLTDTDKVHEEHLYDAEILTSDEQTGLILKALKNLNLEKKTLIIIYGDHGEGFDHDMYHHGNALYNSSVRIPLIIKIPGKPTPHTVNSLIDNTDIMPTILNLLGIDYDKKLVTGKSFENVFTGNNVNYKGKDYIYFRTPIDTTNRTGITDGQYKYIETKSDYCLYNDYKKELYNIKKDPEETTNLIDDEPDIAQKLSTLLSKKFSNSSSTSREKDYNNSNYDYTKDAIKKLKSLGY